MITTMSKTQWRTLARLGTEKADVMTTWGKGFGITRPTVNVLSRLGFVDYDAAVTTGVRCRITAKGRIALAQFQASIR